MSTARSLSRAPRRGGGEIRDDHPTVGRDEAVQLDAPVRDSRLMEPGDADPGLLEHIVADRVGR